MTAEPDSAALKQAVRDARRRYDALLDQLEAEHADLADALLEAVGDYHGALRRLIVSELMRCLPGVAGAIEYISDDLDQRVNED